MKSPRILLVLLVLFLATAAGYAQDAQPAATPVSASSADSTDPLLQIGLAPDQLKLLRRMNAERQPMVKAANQRLRDANKALDDAIYGDNIDEMDFRSRLKEYQDAQADVARIRFENEMTFRRVLTPAQLARFREIRSRIAEQRKERADSIKPKADPGQRPLQKLRQIQRANRQTNPARNP